MIITIYLTDIDREIDISLDAITTIDMSKNSLSLFGWDEHNFIVDDTTLKKIRGLIDPKKVQILNE